MTEKAEMKALWKRIFGDPDAYIGLVFNSYYGKGYHAVRYENDRLVAALLGVPYMFLNPSADNYDRTVRGLYLCGLATDPEHRGRGIMTDLMNEINNRAEKDGFAFTFLIPASESLFRYYKIHGYRTFSFRGERMLNPEPEGDTYDDTISLTPLKEEDEKEAAEFCSLIEREKPGPHLIHSIFDFRTIFHENRIFQGDNIIMHKYGNLINGVAIVSKMKEEQKVNVKELFVEKHYRRSMLALLEKKYGKDNISISTYSNYGTSGGEEGNLLPYAMMRILNEEEILNFVGDETTNSKYSILANEGNIKNIHTSIAEGPIKGEKYGEMKEHVPEISISLMLD